MRVRFAGIVSSMEDVGRVEYPGGSQCGPHGVELGELACRQHGVVSRTQLVGLGFTPRMIVRRMAGGQLHPVHRGVYAVGHRGLSGAGYRIAAVLAVGPDALLSHRSAAAQLGILEDHRDRIDVTTTSRGRRKQLAIVVHRTRRLHPDERTEIGGIPVTSVARTLLDMAEIEPSRRLQRAFEEAERHELLDMNAIARTLDRSHGRHGRKALAALVEAVTGPPPPTKSEWERDFLDFCAEGGLPRPLMNEWVAGHEVDAFWPHAGLVVELDSWEWHKTRKEFEADRLRDAAVQKAGHRALRITYRRMTGSPKETLDDIRALLASGAE